MITSSVLGGLLPLLLAQGAPAPPQPSVFEVPSILVQYARHQVEAVEALRTKDLVRAEKACRAAIALADFLPDAHYNLACALARHGKKEQALTSLATAIERGFARAEHLRQDADLTSLHEEERWPQLLRAVREARPLLQWPRKVEPSALLKGAVEVTESNVAWDFRQGVFRAFFELQDAGKDRPVVNGYGEAGKLLTAWYRDGKAAGNRGDLYDNHDGDHSNMSLATFPQMTPIEFSQAAQKARLHQGLQDRLFYNGVVLGNSSTALVGSPFWRSQPRFAQVNPRTMLVQYNHYVNNHLYFYPEHRDYDPGRNGKGDGYGDVYPANTPFVVISQGSSGSDRAFLDACAATLAAFQPETKKVLTRRGLLMPTVQMILRASLRSVRKDEDYLRGTAHPPVFEGNDLDPVRMVRLAQAMQPDEVPAMVQLQVLREDTPTLGRDYFDGDARGEKLFDTPAAVARVLRSTQYARRLVVSAANSKDINDRALTYRWVILRGDEKAVTIRPLNQAGSEVELTVRHFERFPIAPGDKMESSRLDIGVFVHNGKYHSAPGFVTFYTLDNQKRVYNARQQIESVDYATGMAQYSDPAVDVQKDWRDDYHYQEGQLLGWTRTRGSDKKSFTADGAVVETRDARMRPLTARPVRYLVRPRPGKTALLDFEPENAVWRYEYASDEDRTGRVKKE